MWRLMMIVLLTLCGVVPLAVGQTPQTGGPLVTVTATRSASEREVVDVHAFAEFDANPTTIWSTLTDYNRLEEFVPGIQSSRLLERLGNQVRVSQKGAAKLAFFSFPIDVVLVCTEAEPFRIDVRVESGNLKRLEGGYLIVPLPDKGPLRHRLEWKGLIEPEDALPPVIGLLVMRRNMEAQFDGMVREILRRQALLAKTTLDSSAAVKS